MTHDAAILFPHEALFAALIGGAAFFAAGWIVGSMRREAKERRGFEIATTGGIMPRELDELFAYVCRDAEGNEGILRRSTPIGTQPLIADSRDRADALGAEAARAAMEIGVAWRLVKFTRQEIVGGGLGGMPRA